MKQGLYANINAKKARIKAGSGEKMNKPGSKNAPTRNLQAGTQMTGPEILKAMDNGSTLHGSWFGFWLMNPIDARCTNVHNGAAKSLVRRGLVKRVDDTQYVKTK